jgi:hypothetical protein
MTWPPAYASSQAEVIVCKKQSLFVPLRTRPRRGGAEASKRLRCWPRHLLYIMLKLLLLTYPGRSSTEKNNTTNAVAEFLYTGVILST